MMSRRRRWGLYLLVVLVAAMIGAWLAPSSPSPSLRKSPAEVLDALARIGFPPGMLVSFLLWMIVSIYWEVAGRSETTTKEPFRSRFVHLALTTLAQLLLLFPVPGLRSRFLPVSGALVGLGLAIEALSVVLAVWSRRTLGQHWSGAIATNVGHELVVAGPYRLVRHPIYSAILGLFVGTALVSGEMHALVGLALALIAYARKIRMEEQHLVSQFGNIYVDYQRRTRSLLPGLF